METFSENPNKEELEMALKRKIGKAYKAGMLVSDYDKNIKELRSLREGRKGGLTSQEEARYEVLKRQMEACEVIVPTVMEYKKVLELLKFPEEEIHSLLNHENAHANVAEQVVSQKFEGFRVRFFKGENGKIFIAPSIKSSIDNSFSERQILEDLILVTEAPLLYGSSLSSEDQNIVEEKKKRLAEIE